MKLSKKAVSPLIAAVLLIVVTVGIGAVVTSMIRGYVTENKATMQSKSDEMACSRDVSLTILRIQDNPQICMGTGYVNVVLENSGAAVDDFQLVVMGDAGIARTESTGFSIAKGATQELNMTYNSTGVGNVLQVKVVPKLRQSGSAGYFFCTDVAVTYEGVPSC